MYDFKYRRVHSVEDALLVFNECESPHYYAGGMSLLPVLKLRLDQPTDVIDLGYLDNLRGIQDEADLIRIGAMTPHAVVASSDVVRNKIPALAKLAGSIGDPLIRNRGTIGGSIANNDPSADYPSAVLALNATVHTNRRSIAADDFFLGMFETALENGELILEVTFPVPKRAGYGRFPNPASRYPLVGVFVAETQEGPRVSVTGAAPCVFRFAEMEWALAKNFDEIAIREIRISPDNLQSDLHGTPEYRARLITTMARRAVVETVTAAKA
ncbi:MAG: xanthine dehydrogenase family protein subunit M [Rhodospirillales bacterium]|nr:xanthine dehydrogenase family protein subunit M [Rhodospirillales bacterium]